MEINRIYCEDSLLGMKKIEDSTVDLIITSPPYNFGMDYGENFDDKKKWEDYFYNLNLFWIECKRVLVSGGRICVNIQPFFSDYIPAHHIISNQLLKLEFLWKSEILWDKHNYNAKYTAWGSWCSASMPYLKYTWEFIEVFCKDNQKKEKGNKENDIVGDEFKKWVYAKWDIAPERGMKKFGHPAMFPEEIPERLIKLFSFVGDVVLDPFNGCGTTTYVAKKLNRNYIGFDLSEEYCKTAENRIESVK